mmetsp:Transcript_13511/g.31085  ORF Transcript_13511/g.31085 Transcript_13511/m.31085 type:complete len:137 (-) Transcript_13511:527-937(-)
MSTPLRHACVLGPQVDLCGCIGFGSGSARVVKLRHLSHKLSDGVLGFKSPTSEIMFAEFLSLSFRRLPHSYFIVLFRLSHVPASSSLQNLEQTVTHRIALEKFVLPILLERFEVFSSAQAQKLRNATVAWDVSLSC